MTQKPSFTPPVRKSVSEAGLLQRPDWTATGHRDPRLLWLDKNENTDPVLQAVVFKALAEMDPLAVATYPDAAPFYHKLAAYLGVSPRALILGHGSDGIIGAVFRAFIEPGDRVMLTHPTYAMYPIYAAMFGADTIKLEYRSGEDGPSLDPQAIAQEIRSKRPKLVCLPNPDSPTGTVIEPDALKNIARAALETGALLLIDEAYYPFYPHTVLPWIAEFPNLVVARTFSKAWGLTGVRLGYGVTSIEVAAVLQKFRFNYDTNTPALVLAERMISDFEHEMTASVQRLNRGRDEFIAAMRQLGFRTIRGEASFCHVAFGAAAPQVHAALAGMALYRQDFDVPCLRGYSRFSSTTPELFAPLIARIREVVLSREKQA